MNYLKPLKSLPTHDVDNMPPYMGHQNLWLDDINLIEAVNLYCDEPSPLSVAMTLLQYDRLVIFECVLVNFY